MRTELLRQGGHSAFEQDRRRAVIDEFDGHVGAELAGLDRAGPRLLVLSRCRDELDRLFQSGLLQVAVVPKTQLPPPDAKKPKTPHGWFDLYYEVITPQTIGMKPSQ